MNSIIVYVVYYVECIKFVHQVHVVLLWYSLIMEIEGNEEHLHRWIVIEEYAYQFPLLYLSLTQELPLEFSV